MYRKRNNKIKYDEIKCTEINGNKQENTNKVKKKENERLPVAALARDKIPSFERQTEKKIVSFFRFNWFRNEIEERISTILIPYIPRRKI